MNTFVTLDDPRWRQCHASTVVVAGGEPVLAWFAGTREGATDCRIYLARGGEIQVLETGRDTAHWNPVLATGPGGELWLFAKSGPRISEWITLVTRSRDGGVSWEPVRELVPGDRSGGRGPVKNPPLLTPDGLWLAPGSVERWGEAPRWEPFVDVSADGGRTWRRSWIPTARVPGPGLIQPALWWGPSGPVALMRSSAGRAFRSTSPDGGRIWMCAEPTELPNNNSGLAAVALPSGRVVAVHNPVSEPWGPRRPLVASVSDDDGWSWRTVRTIDDGTGAAQPSEFRPGDAGVRTDGVGEYSYPSLVVHRDELLVSYTWQRRGIALARLPIAALAAELPAELGR